RLEAVLVRAEHRLLERAVGRHDRRDAGALEDDAPLEPDGRVAGVDAPADAVGAEARVEAAEHLLAGQHLAVEVGEGAALEAEASRERRGGPGRGRRREGVRLGPG